MIIGIFLVWCLLVVPVWCLVRAASNGDDWRGYQ